MRSPMAVTNWKMEMTIARSLAFMRDFQLAVGDLAQVVDIVVCPPYTGLYALSRALKSSPIQLGGQDLSAAPGGAYTGQISGMLLVDAGCQWVLVGHWEVRRHLGETDETANHKVHRALEAGLRPIVLIGEAREERKRIREVLPARLLKGLAGCDAGQVRQMALVYEPEWTIGAAQPASPDHVAQGCEVIRQWLAEAYGVSTAQAVRIIYGGSVTPEFAEDLLELANVDGLGASRRGRQSESFAQIVRLIATAKGLS
jgi:triosephosphate isomerase